MQPFNSTFNQYNLGSCELIKLQSMNQLQDKKVDIYQILSYCLGYLKRKIVTLIKISINQKNDTPRPQLIVQLANEQQQSQQYVILLKNPQRNIFKKQDQKLFQRFVYRVKELVRNYLPHASIQHQLFVYLKRIQTYSFRQGYRLEDYVVFILEENPDNLKKRIQKEVKEMKSKKNYVTKSPRRYDNVLGQENFRTISPIRESKKLHLYNSISSSRKEQNIPLNLANDNFLQIKQSIPQLPSPMDIFNRSIKTLDCLDCDITAVRGIYFSLLKEKQQGSLFVENNCSKALKDIQEQMLSQNRLISDGMKAYEKQYAKFEVRYEKDPGYVKRERKRCQTAQNKRKQLNFSALTESLGSKWTLSHKNTIKIQSSTNKPLYQTLSNFPTQPQHQQLYRQLQSRKNTILKMKSISISQQKGHLQLCSQGIGQGHKKKWSMTQGKKGMMLNRNNNSRMIVGNMKKKYEWFLSTGGFGQEILNPLKKKEKLQVVGRVNQSRVAYEEETLRQGNNSEIGEIRFENQKLNKESISLESSDKQALSPTIDSKNFKIESNIRTNSAKQKRIYRRQPRQAQSMRTMQNRQPNNNKSYESIQVQFQTTIKNFMKGANVNHRNYTNMQHREKKLYQTLNPQLTVRMLKKT